MESPLCFSQYFVNKQNVRSYNNIIKRSLLKGDYDTLFLQHIFEEISLVSEVPKEIIKNLSTLKKNIYSKSKDDFRSYFSTISREKDLRSLNKDEIFEVCWTALSVIIPNSLFGGKSNNKIFKKLVRTIVFSMRRQHILLPKKLEQWNFSVQPWLGLSEDLRKTILIKVIIWVLKYVLSPMICLNFYVTTSKLDTDENKLRFFWKNQWQSFYDKKVSDMVFSKVLRRFEPYCRGKKARRNCNLGERLKLKLLKRGIPKLHLVLKPNNDSRPIVRYKSDQQTASEKYRMRLKLNFLKTLTGKAPKKIEFEFNKIYQQWITLDRPNLYFVKTDLSNAFGSINKEKLIKILCERLINIQKREKDAYLKKSFAGQCKEIVSELRKPLLVRAGYTVYEWTEGLVQGYKYSPALSEIYYTYLDEAYFNDHNLKSESVIRFFSRIVDDYIYVTDSLNDAKSFLGALSSYRNVNYDKTVINFEWKNIKSSDEITFLGYCYNTGTLEVSRANNIFLGQICYKIAFSSAIQNLSKFLENRIGQSGIQINGHMFNFHHNSEELIWKHIFTTFCVSANKFCTILAVLCEEKEMNIYLTLYKRRVVVKMSNSIIDTLMRNKPAEYMFMYCINHFRYLAFKALYLCARDTPKCNGLVPIINIELAKSNCLFGKWREHACRIETNGELRRKAIKEVCKRPDLRKIVQNFEVLPGGFECYNNRKLV